MLKTTCLSRIASILSFYIDVKVKGIKVSIGSLGGEFSGISNGLFRIGNGLWYATRSLMLNEELMPKSCGKSRT
jgi:hypothetical protein